MGKQMTGAESREVPALLSSFVGVLEMFGLTAEKGMGTSPGADASQRSNAATAVGDHVGDDPAKARETTATSIRGDSNRPEGFGRVLLRHPEVKRLPSDSGSEDDMPALERLERCTVTTRLNEEAREVVPSFPRRIDKQIWAAGDANSSAPAGADNRRSPRGATHLSSQVSAVNVGRSNSDQRRLITVREVAAASAAQLVQIFNFEQSDIVQPNSGPLGPAARRYHSADRTAKPEPSMNEKASTAVPEAVEAGTRSGGKVTASWEGRYIFMSSATTLLPGMSPACSDSESRGWQQPAPQSEIESLETPATAMAGTTPGRTIPTPLDLSVVAGPAPPARAKNPLKPVVLKGTALDNLRRLGGPSSSVSSFESRGSASATKSSGCEPGGLGAGRGVCGDGVSATGGQILRIDESTALDGVVMDSRRTPPVGATAGVRAAAESKENSEDGDDAPPLPSPMLTGHLRRVVGAKPYQPQQRKQRPRPRQQQPKPKQEHRSSREQRRNRDAPKGRGLRPPTLEDDEGSPPPPPSPWAAPRGTQKVKLRLVRPGEAVGHEYTDDGVSPMGTPLSDTSASTFSYARGATGDGPRGDNASADRNTLRRAAAAVAVPVSVGVGVDDVTRHMTLAQTEPLLEVLGRGALEPFSMSPIVLQRPSTNSGDTLGGDRTARPNGKHSTAPGANRPPHDGSSRHHSVPAEKLSGGQSHVLNIARRPNPAHYDGAAALPSLILPHAPGRVYESLSSYQENKRTHRKQDPATVARSGASAGPTDEPGWPKPPFRLSSSKRLTSFDSLDSDNDDDGDVGNSGVGGRRQNAGEPQASTDRSESASFAGMPRRPTIIDLLSTFESHRSLDRDSEFAMRDLETMVLMEPHGGESYRNVKDASSERGSVGVGAAGVGAGGRTKTRAGRERGGRDPGGSRSSPMRVGRGDGVRWDRISQRRSRSSGSHGGETRRFGGGVDPAGLSSEEILSFNRGRRPASMRSRSSGERGRSVDSFSEVRSKSGGVIIFAGRVDEDASIDRTQYHSESRSRSAEASLSALHARSNGGLEGGFGGTAGGPKPGLHVMGPGSDTGIDYHDGELESVASTQSGFALKTSSREGKGRREPEEREGSQATVRETLVGNSDPSTMTVRRDSVPPASAAMNAAKTRSLRSKSFKKPTIHPAHGTSARRTPIVKKKGRVRTLLGRFFRGEKKGGGDLDNVDSSDDSDDDESDAESSNSGDYRTPQASSAMQDDFFPAQTARSKSVCRARVIATPLRSGRKMSFRGYSRSESQELANASARSGGRPIPLFQGWLVRMFGRPSPNHTRKPPQQQRGRQPQDIASAKKAELPSFSSLGSDGGGNGGGGTAMASSSAYSMNTRVGGTDGGSGIALDRGDVVDDQGHQVHLRHLSLSIMTSAPRKPLWDGERASGSGPVGMAYSRFYDERSPSTLVGDREELGRRAWSLREDDSRDGGARVRHLLRTSLSVKTRQCLLSQKS